MIMQNKRSTRASGLLMSNTLNYNRWQLEIFGQELGEKVLELGCGVGNITLILSQKATKIYALEINPGAIELAREKLKDRPNVEFVECDLINFDFNRFSDLDSIILMNVLEHIEDDIGFLSNIKELMTRTGAKILLLVPAHMWLFGTCDSEVGHFRRYSKKSLAEVLSEAGLESTNIRYMNTIGALGWWVNFVLLKRSGAREEDSSFQVRLFDKFIVPWLRKFEEFINPPFGISIIAILKVNGEK